MTQRAGAEVQSRRPVTEVSGQGSQGELLLDVADLSIDYGDDDDAVHAVDRVGLVLHRGEALGIAGESGSGKSTLAHALARALRPPAVATGGTVLYHPRTDARVSSGPVDVLALQGEELRRFRWQEIAIVLQSAMNALNPVITIREQLDDTLLAHRPGMRHDQADRRAADLLDLVGVSKDRLASYPHQLSGGMRQRVLIAMALALEPELLIMDEPTTALDVVTQRQILQELAALRTELGFAMVFITHDLSLLLEVSDTIAIMYAGRIVETATDREMYDRPAHPYSAGLLRSFPPLTGPKLKLLGIPGSPPDLRSLPPGCAFRPRCPKGMDVCSVQEPRLLSPARFGDPSHRVACWLHVDGMAPGADAPAGARMATPVDVGMDRPEVEAVPSSEHDSATASPVPLLEARNLVKHFPVRGTAWKSIFQRGRVVHAVDDVTLVLRAGMVDALVGESGSGKSTVAKLLAQLERPTGGEIVLRGENVGGRSGRHLRAYRRDVQIVFQDPFASLNPLHTVGYHIGRPLRLHRLVTGAGEEREQVLHLLERVKLTPARQFVEKLPHELSGGQRQRVAIARALAVQPRVLLADEPVSMLDVSIRLSILDLLAELRRDDHLALLYVTHDVASARYFADTISVMYAGRVVEAGPAEQVVQDPRHPYTQLLLSAVPNPNAAARHLGSSLAPGEAPSLINPPTGCRFHPRCPHAQSICRAETPAPTAAGGGHWAACWMLTGYARPDRPGAPERAPTEPTLPGRETLMPVHTTRSDVAAERDPGASMEKL